ncbi:hypothetical protein [Amycolatopsis benzoatilytica]|uniref:hypothetical protein n=1 Tax=Amycolatopsis benzoatilytica TaxID=346045 RepID=UPI00035EF295|nr:hypothetical protein [Amycolatopsis benzoatilytica]
MSTTTVYAEIVKHYRDDDGNLIVEGSATNPSLDLDDQICDPTWLKSAMPDWFEWGNVREQHTAIAAGVGTDLTQDGDNWLLRSKVVDPVSAKKVENDVLKGYSIGIKNPRVITDKSAPGGRIVGGQIVEVSLVDRPCNPTCTLTVTKAAKPGSTVKAVDLDRDHMLVKVEEYAEHQDDREAGADKAADADDTATVEQEPDTPHPALAVVDAVKALGVDLAKASPDEDIASAQEAIAIIGRIIVSEAQSLAAGQLSDACDIDELLCVVRALKWFMCLESEEDVTAPTGADNLVTIPLAAEPDQPKNAEPDAPKTPEPDAAKATGPDNLAELVKAAVTEVISASEERIKSLEVQLAKVLATPVPGGPAITRHADADAAAADLAKTTEATRLTRLANTVTDREMAAYYRNKAAQLTAAPASEGA